MGYSNLFKMAAMSGVVKAINYYISRGDDVNAIDANGQSPLFHAASKGHMDACITLLEAGARADILDIHAKNPSNIAREAQHSELADFLYEVANQPSQAQDNAAKETSISTLPPIKEPFIQELIDPELQGWESVSDPVLPPQDFSLITDAEKTQIIILGHKPNTNEESWDDIDIHLPDSKIKIRYTSRRPINREKNVEIVSPELQEANAEERRTRLKTLIILGKERGYLTYAEINDHLPDDVQGSEQIDGIIGMINDMGIKVFDDADAYDAFEQFFSPSRQVRYWMMMSSHRLNKRLLQ